MSGLQYVGPTSTGQDVETKADAEIVFDSGISRDYVDGRVGELVALRALKTYVDNQDNTYAQASYYPAQDALLVPLTAKGAANGVASLDGTSKIPLAQLPVLGGGILKGPWGPNTAFGGTTGSTPLKIAQWNIGVTGVTGFPLAFLSTSVQSLSGRPVIEIRIGTSAQTTYAAQTLIGTAFGRTMYDDYQIINVMPGVVLNEGQDGVQDTWSPTTSWLVNAWLFDDAGGSSTTSSTSIITAPVFFAATSL